MTWLCRADFFMTNTLTLSNVCGYFHVAGVYVNTYPLRIAQ